MNLTPKLSKAEKKKPKLEIIYVYKAISHPRSVALTEAHLHMIVLYLFE